MKKLLRYTLDLFHVEPALLPNATASAEKVPNSEQKMPFSHDGISFLAIKSVADYEPDCLQLILPDVARTPTPAPLRNPRATREILLDGKQVTYAVKRGKRRTIGFSIGADGLTVSAPKWVPLYELDRAVQAKSSWIIKKLHETRERSLRQEAARIEWKNGATFPFLGQPVTLLVDPLCSRTGLDCAATANLTGQTLHLPLTDNATPTQIQEAVRGWMQQQARALFTARLDHFTPKLGVQWRKLSLTSAATRWGSASVSGAIRLNWRLMHFSQQVIDYVVVHELSHLRVMDHSPRFWATVREVIPDYAALRKQLKEAGAARW